MRLSNKLNKIKQNQWEYLINLGERRTLVYSVLLNLSEVSNQS